MLKSTITTLSLISIPAYILARNSQQLPAICYELNINPKASQSLDPNYLPQSQRTCSAKIKNGIPLPDKNCNPGAINPSVTLAVIQNKRFTTKCLRNQATTTEAKESIYSWYGLSKPTRNRGPTQTCELDHIIPLELGGADTLDNIWPQCGPKSVGLNERFFKEKDIVENLLTDRVRNGDMNLTAAQIGIANDWAQYMGQK